MHLCILWCALQLYCTVWLYGFFVLCCHVPNMNALRRIMIAFLFASYFTLLYFFNCLRCWWWLWCYFSNCHCSPHAFAWLMVTPKFYSQARVLTVYQISETNVVLPSTELVSKLCYSSTADGVVIIGLPVLLHLMTFLLFFDWLCWCQPALSVDVLCAITPIKQWTMCYLSTL